MIKESLKPALDVLFMLMVLFVFMAAVYVAFMYLVD